ncbi:MAG: transcriptional repressor [Oscillospiraceae bacterium]|nr:transcriptional repressor [Oscillospiraceae bacterium]
MQAYMTQPRKRLLNYLHRHADETLSAAQISRDLPEISVSAVYRNLSALEQDGSVRKLAKNGSREVFYQYMKAEECRDHLHLSCKKCGKTFHMDEAETEALLDSIAQLEGFTVDRGDTVLYGVCERCAENKEKVE